MNCLPSVDDIRTDLPGVLERFRAGSTRAFSFGDRPAARQRAIQSGRTGRGRPFTQQILDEVRRMIGERRGHEPGLGTRSADRSADLSAVKVDT
jgi:hypothetical protein